MDELSPVGTVEESQALGHGWPSEHLSTPGRVIVPWRSGPTEGHPAAWPGARCRRAVVHLGHC